MKLWKMQILYQQLAVVDMQDPLYVNKSECKLPEWEKKYKNAKAAFSGR